MQNIWEQSGYGLRRQKRRAQLVKRYLKANHVRTVLDCGCSEGYTKSFISELSDFIVGVELDIATLKIARSKINRGAFINASINYLPFRENCFDAVCILEVLEHLKEQVQLECLVEVDRVLCSKGVLLVSVPYKEKIIYTRCVSCNELTLPKNRYVLIRMCHLPNLGMISCSGFFESTPVILWLVINDFLGLLKKGYWIVLEYVKH